VSLSFQPVKPLLQTGTSALSRWLSYIGLGLGVLLLLSSVQMFINIRQLMGETKQSNTGFQFVSITKVVTDETMGDETKNSFNQQEIEELKAQPFIEDAAPLLANEFHVELSAAGIFRTDLFLESLENDFLDTLPPGFTWQEGGNVPIIVGSDWFEAYNVFAPGQGLPQMSKSASMNVPIFITCYGRGRTLRFRSNIVAYSDRVNSVLVPKNFLEYLNTNLGEKKQGASRVFIKTKDANNTQLLNFLEQKNYLLNKEKTRFAREKRIVEGILGALGVFGLLVVFMALMLFSFYLQLVIARSRENLQLLLLLGYSPGWLGKNLSRRFIPVYVVIVFTALALTQLMQWGFHHYLMFDREELQTPLHWIVILAAVVLICLSILTNFRMVRKLLHRLY
jgi:hypothetical protein